MENQKTVYETDPNLTEHCGCGVPFSEHCPTCADYLGSTYHRPDESVLRRERHPGATYFFDGELHVGTVRTQNRGRCLWITRFVAGHTATFDDALVAMRKELLR